jgi:hypothetical protein
LLGSMMTSSLICCCSSTYEECKSMKFTLIPHDLNNIWFFF